LSLNQGKVALPLRIFELSNIYLDQGKTLPDEKPILATATQGLDFLKAKGELEAYFEFLKVKPVFKPLSERLSLWQPLSSATIHIQGRFIGVFGLLSKRASHNFGLSSPVHLTNLDFRELLLSLPQKITYTPVSAYPPIIEDITLTSDSPVQELITKLSTAHPLIVKLDYQGSFNNRHTFTVYFNAPDRNLTQEEVNKIKADLLKIT
ncbi:hypothetical protein HY333_01130, partial [Candidatus Collierbacteria bacterium]|nr:hypothetical protein [Candidatus Collierbacteria bacterium]